MTDSQLPLSWDPMTAGETFKQVVLSPTSSEYRDVEKNVMSTAGNRPTLHQIISVNTTCSALLG